MNTDYSPQSIYRQTFVMDNLYAISDVKAIPLQVRTGPEGSRIHKFQDNRHTKVVRLSALRTGRLYP